MMLFFWVSSADESSASTSLAKNSADVGERVQSFSSSVILLLPVVNTSPLPTRRGGRGIYSGPLHSSTFDGDLFMKAE